MTINNKEICKTNNILKDNKFTIQEESDRYDKDLELVFYNTREVLDNLETYREYRVRWKNYKNKIPTLPYSFVRNEKDL